MDCCWRTRRTMTYREDNDILNVKLRGSGQIINLSRMPDEFVDVLHDVITGTEDPYTILAAWAYMFAGLSIDEIRERFIIQEGTRAKFVSREYVRQKIKVFYEEIHRVYSARYGESTISTLYYNKYTHMHNVSGSNITVMEDYVDEGNITEEQDKNQEPDAKEDDKEKFLTEAEED